MRARGKEIYIITAVVAVVLIVAWYFLLFSPTQRKLSDLGTQVQSAQSALDMANQEVVKLESYKKTFGTTTNGTGNMTIRNYRMTAWKDEIF